MLFKDYFVFSYGFHIVQWTRAICAIAIEGIIGSILCEFILNLGKWFLFGLWFNAPVKDRMVVNLTTLFLGKLRLLESAEGGK